MYAPLVNQIYLDLCPAVNICAHQSSQQRYKMFLVPFLTQEFTCFNNPTAGLTEFADGSDSDRPRYHRANVSINPKQQLTKRCKPLKS